jgi:hypothetical protein
MADLRYKIVTFNAGGTRIALTLDGAWRLSAGLKPDTNSALVPYTEWDKLGVPDAEGTIEFWFTTPPGDAEGDPGVGGQPDVSLDGWRIVEVRSSKIGIPLGQTAPRVIEYHVFFQDGREQFVEPRGGRLRLGLINAGAAPADDADAQVPEMSLSQLIQACVSKMGATVDGSLPADVDQVDAPRDLKWFGNHAPSELAKLLDLAGLAFCPQSDGTFNLQRVTNDGTPQITGGTLLPEVPIPAIDRRGKIVIFSSFPLPITETLTLEGPRDDQWQFVVQDSIGRWKAPADCDLVNNNGGLLAQWQKKFADVDLKYRARITGQAYRFIRLGDGSNPPAGEASRPLPPAQQSPVLNRLIQQDGSVSDLTVTAKVATFDQKSGQWSNTSGVTVPARFKSGSNILELGSALIQVSQPTNDLWGGAQELSKGDVQVTFTIPQYEQVQSATGSGAGANWQPKYFHVGFQRSGGGVTQLSDDAVANALDGGARDAVVIPCGELLRLRVYNDNPANKADLVALAQGWADRLLANANKPMRVIEAAGFASCEISGLVSEIEWDQEHVRTAVGVNNWYRPAGVIDAATLGQLEGRSGGNAQGEAGAGAAAGAFPLESLTQSTRQSLGEPGATLPMVPLQPIAAPPAPPPETAIAQVGDFIGAGAYNGTLMLGDIDDEQTASDLTMANEGLTFGPSCLILVTEEDSAVVDGFGNAPKGVQRLMHGSYVTGVMRGTSNEDPPRPIVVVRGGVGNMSNAATTGPASYTQTTADNQLWSRGGAVENGASSNVISGPFNEYVLMRVVWNAMANEFDAFIREHCYDARGLLYRRGPEEKVTITGTNPSCS